MQLVVYNLVGALFAPSDQRSVSQHTDKLFAGVIKEDLPDPGFGPPEIAARAGRYAICRSCSRSTA
jgi:hypothetical protein